MLPSRVTAPSNSMSEPLVTSCPPPMMLVVPETVNLIPGESVSSPPLWMTRLDTVAETTLSSQLPNAPMVTLSLLPGTPEGDQLPGVPQKPSPIAPLHVFVVAQAEG